jgi:hypothetical protein
MMLPPNDMEYLRERAPGYSLAIDSGMICVIIPAFALGTGFDLPNADLMLRLAAGYPDVPPDMWWFSPAVRRTDGDEIPATQAVEHHFGKPWQRWSRHLVVGQWRSGVDCVESYIAIIRNELRAVAAKAAA